MQVEGVQSRGRAEGVRRRRAEDVRRACVEGEWRRRVESRLVAPADPRCVDGEERAARRGDRIAWPARCEREARAAPIVEAEKHIIDVRLQLVHLAVD